MRMFLTASPLLLLALGGCMNDGNQASTWQAAAATGAPVNCIETSRITETQVRSDSVVDFRLRGGTTYRNTLPTACSTLRINRSFNYRSDAGQLCAIDTIQVRPSGGGLPGPTCGLGQFQQIDLPVG